MTKQEVMATRYGEFTDLLSCLAIYKGNAKQKHEMTFDEVLSMR